MVTVYSNRWGIKIPDKLILIYKMEKLVMKGFNTGDGYMGLVNGKYILFASESDYYDYMND